MLSPKSLLAGIDFLLMSKKLRSLELAICLPFYRKRDWIAVRVVICLT